MANVNTLESLKNFFEAGEVLKPVEEGKHTCKVLAFDLIEREATTEKEAMSWVKITLKLEDRTATPLFNERSFRIVMAQLRNQLGIEDNISVPSLMATVMAQDSIDCWVTRKVVLGDDDSARTFINYSFTEPRMVAVSDSSADTAEIEL